MVPRVLHKHIGPQQHVAIKASGPADHRERSTQNRIHRRSLAIAALDQARLTAWTGDGGWKSPNAACWIGDCEFGLINLAALRPPASMPH